MNRRTVLQLSCAMLAMPGWVLGQTPRVYRLGWLLASDEATTKPLFEVFVPRMRELGYSVGRNLVNEMRWAEGDQSRYPALADQLIALKPDILLGIQEAARVMAAKTSTIPIVLIASADPVAVGLVRSLARPGTNVTGMSGLYDQLLAKQIELLTEVVPRMSRVAYLSDSSSGTREQFEQVARDAASAKGLSLTIAAASDLQGIRRAFTEFAKERVHAVAVQPSGPMAFFRNAIAGEASRLRLPSISGGFQFAESGGLISYSASILENMRNQLPIYVDRILKGAKPADLPVQQSTKYEFVVNLKTARAIGITIPRSVLLRADRVIE